MLGTSQCVPCFSIIGNHNTSSLGVALERIAVDNEVDAVGVFRIIYDGSVAHVKLDVAAGHAEGNSGGDIAFKELRLVAVRLHVRVVRVKHAPTEAVVTGKLPNRQVAVDSRGIRTDNRSRVMRAGDGVGNRLAVQNCDRDFILRIRVDGVSGIRITNAVGSQFRCANLDGQTVARPKQETLGDVIGRGINIDDCVLISRALEEKLDAEDFISDAYILEVSSPGLGRPLKKEKDFKRSIGKAVECKLYKAIDKQKEFEGVLKDFTEDTVTIEIDEKDLVLDRKDIAMIRLAIEF